MHQRIGKRRQESFLASVIVLLVLSVLFQRRAAFLDARLSGETFEIQPRSSEGNDDVQSIGESEQALVEHHFEQQEKHSGESRTEPLEQNEHRLEIDPCSGRPSPDKVEQDPRRPPSLYFLHIPKTAGTLVYQLVIDYANRTNGLACQFLYDGNRFGPEEFSLSTYPPPQFPNATIEEDVIKALRKGNKSEVLTLFRNGACRTIRGHVTYKQRDEIRTPVLSMTIVRDPLERFLSMYEFAMMMVKTNPGRTGWDSLISGDFTKDFANATSILHRGFYDQTGKWLASGNVGFSFFFYGVLHQLSGMKPAFAGVGSPSNFSTLNARDMAEKAKDNICATHILGSQSDMNGTLGLFFETLKPYAQWSEAEQLLAKVQPMNKNHMKSSRKLDDYFTTPVRQLLERRLLHEIEVYNFTLSVIAYRRHVRDRSHRNHVGP